MRRATHPLCYECGERISIAIPCDYFRISIRYSVVREIARYSHGSSLGEAYAGRVDSAYSVCSVDKAGKGFVGSDWLGN
jgi:hypothetical protein